MDPQSRPSFTDLVDSINTNLICDNHYLHVRVVGVKWTASANLLVRAHAPSPTVLVDALESATQLMTFPAYIKDIIPNVRWSRVVLSNVFTGKTPDSPAHPPHIIHHELSAANPEYKNLIIRLLNEAEGRVRQPGNAVTGTSHKTRISGPMCL